MARLSKREYFLISLLVVILIWFLGWNQLLKPQMDSLKEAGERLAQLDVQREQVEQYIGRKPEETSGGAGTDTGFFYIELEDVEIDRLLQQMAAEADVDIRSMEIGKPAVVERKLPGSDQLAYTGISKVPLRYIQVSMELEAGTFDQVAAMAEQIYSLDKSVVTDHLEAEAVYGRDSTGNPAFRGVQCTMGVSFYYTDRFGTEGDGA